MILLIRLLTLMVLSLKEPTQVLVRCINASHLVVVLI
ncbi:hypothetical protein [Klebsiella phage KpF2]|nr:hypothetical protein [Klebsiella phage KpF2]